MRVKTRKSSPRKGLTSRTFEGPPGSMRVLLGEYAAALLARNYSPDTLRSRTADIHRFLDWCDDRALTNPTDVTQPILERFQQSLFYYRQPNGRPLTFRTQHHVLTSVKSFFRWLTRTRLTLFNPAAELELPKISQRLPRVIFTAQEADWVINQPDISHGMGIRDRAILETFYATGIRRKELTLLKLYDLDASRGTLMIREGKGLKDRVVPLGARALAWIETYITQVRPDLAPSPDEGFLFLSQDGEPFRQGSRLGHLVHQYIKQADIGKSGGCHVFRHTMATLMLENGADIRYIQEILGHARLTATQIYTQVSIQKLKQIHQATHPAEQTWRDPREEKGAAPKTAAEKLLDALDEEARLEEEDREEE